MPDVIVPDILTDHTVGRLFLCNSLGAVVGVLSSSGLVLKSSTGSDVASIGLDASNRVSLGGGLLTADTSGAYINGANGSLATYGTATELLTLSTGGTTTDTTANLLPAGSLILGAVARVTTTITTATSWAVGDGTTSARFATANSTMTAGATSIGLNQANAAIAGAAFYQAAAAKVRITTVGTPGAGVIRIVVFYVSMTAPTS